MIFRVCEHYDDEQPIYYDYYDKECFVCFELKSSHGLKTINLINQTLYINRCVCNGPIHKECLELWFNMNNTCPICRNRMIERNNTTVFIFSHVPYGIYIYFFIKTLILRTLRIIAVFMFLHKLIEFHLMVIGNRYRNISSFDDEYYV